MHEGHRKRLYEKLKDGERLYDHELLEMLLFNAYPRKNTNPVAHALMERFGSISEILGADVKELEMVEGVGEQVALYLNCIGKCIECANIVRGIVTIKNHGDFKNFAAMRMRGRTEEYLELYLMDKSGRINRIFEYTSQNKVAVTVRVNEIVNILSASKPYGLLAAHNHIGGTCAPSANDDSFTAKVHCICALNNVKFVDHCICSDDGEVYSYYDSGMLDELAKSCSAEKLIDLWTKNSETT